MKANFRGFAPLFLVGVLLSGASLATADTYSYSLAAIRGVAGDYITSTNGQLSDGCMVNVESQLIFDGNQIPLRRNWLVSHGQVTELGRESGYTGQKTYEGMQYVIDINSKGTVIGIFKKDYPFVPEGMIWKNGKLKYLPKPSAEKAFYPSGINDAGVIVGNIFDQNFYNSPARLVGNQFMSLEGAGFEWVGSINNRGQIAGVVRDSSVPGNSIPAISQLSGRLTNLSLPSGKNFSGLGKVNNNGSITGSTFDPITSTLGGHVWKNPRVRIDLGDNVYPTAINDSGMVIGTKFENSEFVPFLWSAEDGMTAVRDMLAPTLKGRVTIHSANAINNAGQILVDFTTIDDPAVTQAGVLYRRGSAYPCALR